MIFKPYYACNACKASGRVLKCIFLGPAPSDSAADHLGWSQRACIPDHSNIG